MLKAKFRLRSSFLFGVALAVVASPTIVRARTEIVLHRFAGGSDGAYPDAPPIIDLSGNLFGTTFEGGGPCVKRKGCGTVFKLAPDGTETLLYAFKGGRDGFRPDGRFIEDQQGNLYGTTYGGRGTVFEVTQSGMHTILHHFKGGVDGAGPIGVVGDDAGNLYGTTFRGGPSCVSEPDGCGTVYKISSKGFHKVLHAFDGNDGEGPASLVRDTAGNLYGVTYSINGFCCGTVFKVSSDHTFTTLYAFKGGQDGSTPYGALVLDAAGNLYGTTTTGGGGSGCGSVGCGTIFEVAPDGTETVLYSFTGMGDGIDPYAGMIMDGSGNLFGTTVLGGTAGCGTVFEFIPGSELKTLYSFSCGSDGANPAAGLSRDAQGDLYGATVYGGNQTGYDGFGTVFVLQK